MIEKQLTQQEIIIDLEILDQIVYNQTLEEINNKLKPIGLKCLNIELKYPTLIENIDIDLINIDLWEQYYFKNNGLKCYIPYIKDQQDFKDYNYTVLEYVKELLEEVFNEPDYYYNDVLKHDLCVLSNDLLSDIFRNIENYYLKSMELIYND